MTFLTQISLTSTLRSVDNIADAAAGCWEGLGLHEADALLAGRPGPRGKHGSPLRLGRYKLFCGY